MALATVAGLTLTTGWVPGQVALAADTPAEIAVPATPQASPPYTGLQSAGATGYLQQSSTPGYRGLEWTSYDGTARPVPGAESLTTVGLSPYYGSVSDIVALPSSAGTAGREVNLKNMATGESWTVSVPVGQRYIGAIGDTVVSFGEDSVHLLRRENGGTADRLVTGYPEGAVTGTITRAGVGGLAISFTHPDRTSGFAWLDIRSATLTSIPAPTTAPPIVTSHHVVVTRDRGILVYEQGKFDSPVQDFEPALYQAQVMGVVGDALIVARPQPAPGEADWRVVAVPFDGSVERPLIAQAESRTFPHPGGGLVAIGGASALDFGFNLITAGPDGKPQVKRARTLPPDPMSIRDVALDENRLTTLELGDGEGSVYERPLTSVAPGYGTRETKGSPAPGAKQVCGPDEYCPDLIPTGDGRFVYVGRILGEDGILRLRLYAVGSDRQFPGTALETGLADTYLDSTISVLGASGRYVVVYGQPAGGGAHERRVLDLDAGGKLVQRVQTGPAALWEDALWTSVGTSGKVTATNVRTGAILVSTGIPGCQTVTDLRAHGRWLYWSCQRANSFATGVYDLHTQKNVTLPEGSGRIELGDGFVVRNGFTYGSLRVFDVRSGSLVERSVDPAAGLSDLDPETGQLAYSMLGGDIRIRELGKPGSGLAPVATQVTPLVETDATPVAWRGQWWLSKPIAGWTLTLRHTATGRVVATRTGGPTEAPFTADWDGRTATGGLLPNGTYTWSLTAQPVDGQGSALTLSGTSRLVGGTAVRRDHVGADSLPDGNGDLLVRTTSGSLDFWHGSGAGRVSGKTAGAGWGTTVNAAVPFGDVNGDNCNDVMLRMSSGELRTYKPGCGKPLTPAVAYTKAGGGFGGMNLMTSPGDLTGDGRADLVARNGDSLYLYAGKAGGTVASGVKFGSGWSPFTHLVGVGDLNNDGNGDLLARKSDGSLYRYDGAGAGRLKAAVKIASGWGASYTTVVGVGDLDSDAKRDLVARDKAGLLFRISGDGKGGFGAPVQIGSGWGSFKGLF